MIWAVKILALNKKDGKGNDLYLFTKKSLLTKTRPEIRKTGSFTPSNLLYLDRNIIREIE
jgi:hypothetical protein